MSMLRTASLSALRPSLLALLRPSLRAFSTAFVSRGPVGVGANLKPFFHDRERAVEDQFERVSENIAINALRKSIVASREHIAALRKEHDALEVSMHNQGKQTVFHSSSSS